VESFPERVYAIVLTVPRGRVISYGAIARLLGDPRKARQVGWAMAALPERRPRIPAHRVIRASGELPGGQACGGYSVHRARLETEGVHFLLDGRVDLDRYFWMPPEPAMPELRQQKSDGPPKRIRLTSEI
jgi:methylated-DNA-protein-cysteine methyltransferase related protein